MKEEEKKKKERKMKQTGDKEEFILYVFYSFFVIFIFSEPLRNIFMETAVHAYNGIAILKTEYRVKKKNSLGPIGPNCRVIALLLPYRLYRIYN